MVKEAPAIYDGLYSLLAQGNISRKSNQVHGRSVGMQIWTKSDYRTRMSGAYRITIKPLIYVAP